MMMTIHDHDLAGLDDRGGGGHCDGNHGGAQDHQEGGHLRHAHPRPTLQGHGVMPSIRGPQLPDSQGDEVSCEVHSESLV